MVKNILNLRDNINFLSASDQARHLKKSVENKISNMFDYPVKEQDLKQVSATLSAVDTHLNERHVVIHSVLIAKSGTDEIIRKNRRTGVEEKIESQEVIDLANDLFELQSQIDGLKFAVARLIEALSK